MSPSSRGRILFLFLLLICLALSSLAQVSQQDNSAQPAGNQAQTVVPVQFHGVPWRDPNGVTVGIPGTSGGAITSGPVGFAAPAGAHLNYFGGPVISNVQVVQVLYGNGSYLPQVAGTVTPNVGTFFSDIANSSYMDMLSEYNTNIAGGTNQIIGHGSFAGLLTIIPSAANNGATISDAQIQSELLAQITAGHLPGPITDAAGNVNTLYMIYFPPGKKITLGGSNSCQAGGFCAFHGTTRNTFQSRHVLYGVHPDMQAGSGCDRGCGNSPTTFGNVTSVSSHEFAEAVTDAQVGINVIAWNDNQFGEIGDICNGQQGQFTANGTTYTIQLEFSNRQNNCILPPANVNNPNFSLSATPASVSVTQGSSAGSTITVTPSGGFTGNVTLSTSGLPVGVTAAFGTNPATSTSTVTFNASATATTGTSTVTITGTSGALTHTTTISLTVTAVAAPNFSLSASPASVAVTQGSSASSMVTVTPSGGFTGNVTLSASGLPAGVTAAFGTNPATSTSTVTFNASATATTGTSTVTITGTSGTLTHTTTISLTVNAAGGGGGAVTLSPASLNFGTIPANTSTAWQPFTLKNIGTTAVSVSSEAVSGPFAVFSQCGTSFSLSAGASCTVFVMFQPTSAGTFAGTLTVTDSAGTQTSTLTGTAN